MFTCYLCKVFELTSNETNIILLFGIIIVLLNKNISLKTGNAFIFYKLLTIR